MKAETYHLINDNILNNAIMRMKELECNGKFKLVISNAGDKSARQRGLDWMWSTDIAKSGMGGEFEDTKENVHRVCKYRWAIPILIRDDPFFAELYALYIQLYKNNPDKMLWFVDSRVHTEELNVSQMSEYLTEKQRYYLDNGFPLRDPQDKKLLEFFRESSA
jgi:hypothetical protein